MSIQSSGATSTLLANSSVYTDPYSLQSFVGKMIANPNVNLTSFQSITNSIKEKTMIEKWWGDRQGTVQEDCPALRAYLLTKDVPFKDVMTMPLELVAMLAKGFCKLEPEGASITSVITYALMEIE